MVKPKLVRDELQKLNARIRYKPEYVVWYHRLAAWLASFLVDFKNYATTIPRIFSNQTIIYMMNYAKGQKGEMITDSFFPLLSHEIAHVYIERDMGTLPYIMSYLLSASKRKHIEKMCLGIHLWNYINTENPQPEDIQTFIDRHIQSLGNYLINKKLDETDEMMLRSHLEQVIELHENTDGAHLKFWFNPFDLKDKMDSLPK